MTATELDQPEGDRLAHPAGADHGHTTGHGIMAEGCAETADEAV